MTEFAPRFHHAGVCVGDLDRALAWYEKVLDFVLERRSELPTLPARIAIVRNGDLRFELFEVAESIALPEDRKHPNRDLKTQGNKHVAFCVPDLAATRELLVARGAEVALDYQDRVFFIRDDTGNLIEFIRADR